MVFNTADLNKNVLQVLHEIWKIIVHRVFLFTIEPVGKFLHYTIEHQISLDTLIIGNACKRDIRNFTSF